MNRKLAILIRDYFIIIMGSVMGVYGKGFDKIKL
jgi:hypothetical protein